MATSQVKIDSVTRMAYCTVIDDSAQCGIGGKSGYCGRFFGVVPATIQ
jgi:glutaminase